MSLERDAVQDFFGWIFNILGYVTGTMVLFQISTIDPSMVLYSKALVRLGTDVQSDFPRTGCVLLGNVGRTQLSMIWWSWLHGEDCRSDASGSDLVEYQSEETRMWLTRTQILRENPGHHCFCFFALAKRHQTVTVCPASSMRWSEISGWICRKKNKLGAHDGALRQRAVLPLHTVVRTNWFGEKPGGHVVCNVYILCRRWVIW